MFRGRSFLTRANIILYILLEEDYFGGVYRKKVPFLDTLSLPVEADSGEKRSRKEVI